MQNNEVDTEYEAAHDAWLDEKYPTPPLLTDAEIEAEVAMIRYEKTHIL